MRRLALLAALLFAPAAFAQMPTMVNVSAPTRLDWEFCARGFPDAGGKLDAGYDSTKQKYQLYLPAKIDPKKSYALLAFISPTSDPVGWNAFSKLCIKKEIIFCSPAAAGNNVKAAQRARVILDMIDDVRKKVRIDPDQTYISGFSGGGRMSCALAFSLPEVFAGCIPVCGTNPITAPTYLRHRLVDRTSVAFVTGENDFNRKENEAYMAPYFTELGIRTKLWVVPEIGHYLPDEKVMAQVVEWVAEDVKRRRDDSAARPNLVFGPQDTPTPSEQAKRFLKAAEEEFKAKGRTWNAVVLMQGILMRWPKSEEAKFARAMLQKVQQDERLLEIIGDLGAQDEQKFLSAQAKGLEAFGDTKRAIEAWRILAKNYEKTPAGDHAAEQIRRLDSNVYLGLGLVGNTIEQIAPKGPAEKAGLKRGDKLLKLGNAKIESVDDMLKAALTLSVGAKVQVEILREERPMTLTIVVGTRPK